MAAPYTETIYRSSGWPGGYRDMRVLTFSVIQFALLVASSAFSHAQSLYGVSFDTSQLQGLAGKVVFDLASNTPLTNRFDVINFSTDGTLGLPNTQGTLVAGDLIQGVLPAKFTRIKGNTFFTELQLPFIKFGKSISFIINVSETAPKLGTPPDEVSLFLVDQNDQPLVTGSGNDIKPILTVTINGQRGGALSTINGRRGGLLPTRLLEPRPNNSQPAPALTFAVTPAWTKDVTPPPQAQIFLGTLTEFCGRRCVGEIICTGGKFGISVNANTFYTFDDVSNLRAQVAIVSSGQNPLRTGDFNQVEVLGTLNKSVLTVHNITLH